jgi:hypothetical protein
MPRPLKFFRVAVEGATCDGRTIERAAIEQMADSYDPNVYGARIWLEHIRGTLADSPFRAYGDITALKASEVDMPGGKKLALFAEIDPTPDLIAMTKARQKIYSSLEINPKFADTGLPYLAGLGVTDSPASLGTEILKFAAQSKNGNPFAARKADPGNLYSEAVEVEFSFDETETEPEVTKLSTVVKKMIEKFKSKKVGDDERFSDITEAVETLINHVADQEEKFSGAKLAIDELHTALEIVTADFTEFKEKIDTEDRSQQTRPAATGGDGEQQTDF